MQWVDNDSYIIGKTIDKTQVFDDKTKVYAFDLDHTIIKPKKGKRFSSSATDWEFFTDDIVTKVKELAKNYNIVIVSNQKGISMGRVNKDLWKKKLEDIADYLDIPLTVCASTHGDKYRKPLTKMWDDNIICDRDNSIYCGDAGGLGSRKILGKYYRDFSDSDLKFALNLGVQFVHRDVFVFGNKYKKQLAVDYPLDLDKLKVEKYKPFKKRTKEMIIMIGYPGSGKSYYCNKYIVPKGYKYINQDTLKTAKKCVEEAEKQIINKKSIVIDNTNPSVKARLPYINLAKKYGWKIRGIVFKTSKELSMHNNYYRHIMTDRKTVPNIAYNIYKKNYVEPNKDEGFNDIEKLQFKLEILTDEYKQYMH